MTERFGGKVAVVTGAGAGMGAAVARRLAAEGAAVAAFDRDGAAAAEVVKEIRAAGGTAEPFEVDIRDSARVAAAIGSVTETLGGLDVLINVAGVVRYGEVPDFAEEEWDLVLDTNLKGTYLTAKYAIPAMRARGGGAIVNFASVQAFASQQLVAAYSASKGAVVALTRTLALDHAKDNIRVNCVCPGSVETPMLRYGAQQLDDRDPAEVMREWGGLHPLGRLIQPEDVAGLVAFLASDDAAVITGAPHLVDGGLLAKLGV
ncbi:SDR family NAD(P)-dependent oxidoreductase [Actinophytocola sp.]|jgi:NAD(P)-dependent dehydrogenase (short-subunit alcohol dehydrogenase family)|uniref:SDR family NAD(P)-dependent oxidoreductase n=1 Tax=Actinophytocola sp. TaxID=1872138 RepID=UPI002EDAE77E